jgi:hypothetical protein
LAECDASKLYLQEGTSEDIYKNIVGHNQQTHIVLMIQSW